MNFNQLQTTQRGYSMPRIFARKFVPDVRDRAFGIPMRATQRRRRFWYDGNWHGDQGSTPHCVGFAFAHWLVASPVCGNFVAPHGLYEICKLIDGDKADGTTIRSGAKALKKLGAIVEYRWATGLGQLVNAVLERGPVVVGTDWYTAMSNPDAAGRITSRGQYEGGHAYLISGVCRDRKLFRIKNSWGTSWGVNGRAWITFDEFARLLNRRGEALLALETKLRAPKR